MVDLSTTALKFLSLLVESTAGKGWAGRRLAESSTQAADGYSEAVCADPDDPGRRRLEQNSQQLSLKAGNNWCELLKQVK